MTMGSKKASTRSSLRAPKFLDKSGGFYGRLGEADGVPPSDMAVAREEEEVVVVGAAKVAGQDGIRQTGGVGIGAEDVGDPGFDANDDSVAEGDDGETLLRVKLGRSSSRWSRRSKRSSKRKQQMREDTTTTSAPDGSLVPGAEEVAATPSAEVTANQLMPGTLVVHFASREDADDQVLIRDKKRGREEEEDQQGEEEEEGEEERRLRREQEEGVKALKRNSVKNYRKALDRAFRRGWEAFVTNLYSVTLTPVTASATTTTTTTPTSSKLSLPSKSFKKKVQCDIISAEFI